MIAKSNKDQEESRTEDSYKEKEKFDSIKQELLDFARKGGKYPDELFK